MAKPITATPVLKGEDLVRLLQDVQRPDKAKDIRSNASKSLRKVVARGRSYVPKNI